MAGRSARLLLCPIPLDEPPFPDREIWVDTATGMLLKDVALYGARFEVTRVELDPAFPSTAFVFEAPVGAVRTAEADKDPLRLTRLAKGSPAPPWSTSTLDGRTLTRESLAGRPSLVIMTSCAVGIEGNEGCDLLPALQTVYEEWRGRANLLWVAEASNAATIDEGKEIPGTALAMIRFVVANNGYGFTVAPDIGGCDPSACHAGPIDQAWYDTAKGDCCPPRLYVTLDAAGTVVDVRKDRQSAAQLGEMLRAASR